VPTTVLSMQLVEAGTLSLDTSISTLLPPDELAGLFVVDGVDRTSEVTLRQLLDHTSGVADYFEGPVHGGPALTDLLVREPERIWQPRDLLDWTRERQHPVGNPGQSFAYSDTGYILVGRILEEVTGSPFHDLLRDRIFRPLGMADSYLMFRAEPENDRRSIAPLWIGDTEASTFSSLSCDWAGGGIVTTLDDLVRFSEAFHSARLISHESLASLARFQHRLRSGIYYGIGLMQLRFEGFLFLLRGLPRPIGHTGVLSTHLFYDAAHDAHIALNFHSTKEMARSVRTLIRVEQLLQA
jgi:D-alanyl-D-alanine carboxypeptidase